MKKNIVKKIRALKFHQEYIYKIKEILINKIKRKCLVDY